ncbi:hypothetical protein EV360DRAFT_89426 [Lentinula raphanica]|nr:hypothetical protein EV360DRAFT_89426 [Lentinula raphanica]
MQPPLFGMGSYLKIFLVLILGLFTLVHTAPAPMDTPTNSVMSNLKEATSLEFSSKTRTIFVGVLPKPQIQTPTKTTKLVGLEREEFESAVEHRVKEDLRFSKDQKDIEVLFTDDIPSWDLNGEIQIMLKIYQGSTYSSKQWKQVKKLDDGHITVESLGDLSSLPPVHLTDHTGFVLQ